MITHNEEDQPLDWSILEGRIISDLAPDPAALMEIRRNLDPDVYKGDRPVTEEEIKHALVLTGKFKPYRPQLKCA